MRRSGRRKPRRPYHWGTNLSVVGGTEANCEARNVPCGVTRPLGPRLEPSIAHARKPQRIGALVPGNGGGAIGSILEGRDGGEPDQGVGAMHFSETFGCCVSIRPCLQGI